MKKQFTLVVAILIACSFQVKAQKNVTLAIQNLLGTTPYTDKIIGTNDLGNSFKLTRVDYYISGISLIHDGGTITPVTNKYILVTGANNTIESLGSFNVTNVEGIKFYIGVDSVMNHSDPSILPTTHALAPKNPAMHWGWASGYRFIALEGKAGASFNTTFELHGLFDQNYFSQTVMATGVNSGNDITINLDADYTKSLKGIDVTVGPIFHGDNSIDLDALKNFRDFVFSPGAGIPNAVQDILKESDVNIYPNPSNGSVHITINNNSVNVSSIEIMDITGRLIKEISLKNEKQIDLNINNKGIYLLKFYQGKQIIAHRKLLIE